MVTDNEGEMIISVGLIANGESSEHSNLYQNVRRWTRRKKEEPISVYGIHEWIVVLGFDTKVRRCRIEHIVHASTISMKMFYIMHTNDNIERLDEQKNIRTTKIKRIQGRMSALFCWPVVVVVIVVFRIRLISFGSLLVLTWQICLLDCCNLF